MYPRGMKTCVLLTLLIFGLSEAFNSGRPSAEADERVAAVYAPNFPLESAGVQKRDERQHTPDELKKKPHSRVRRQRHYRNTNDYNMNSDSDMSKIFSYPTPYNYPVNNFEYGPPQQQFQPPTQYHQNTYVPNGSQINHYYQNLPFQWFQSGQFQVGALPYSTFQNNHPIIILVPVCFFLNPQQAPAPTPMTTTEKPVTKIDNRNTFDDTTTVPPPPINYDKFYNTQTGISLDVVRPFRPPTGTQPPSEHVDPNEIPAPSQDRPLGAAPRPIPTRPPPSRPLATQPPRTVRPNIPLRPLTTTTTTPRSVLQNGSSNERNAKCIWAIIQCCSSNRQNAPSQNLNRCFSSFGCNESLFYNPCDSEFSKSVVNVVDADDGQLIFS